LNEREREVVMRDDEALKSLEEGLQGAGRPVSRNRRTTLARVGTRLSAVGSLVMVFMLMMAMMVVVPAGAGAAEAKPFGIAKFSMEPTERTVEKPVVEGGRSGVEFVSEPYETLFTQAGGHPWGLTLRGEFATKELDTPSYGRLQVPSQEPKDVVVSLPLGCSVICWLSCGVR
jgi:hypothetical protein